MPTKPEKAAPVRPGERTVRVTIRGQQTDPEGHTQENIAVHRAVYTAVEGGHQLCWQEGEETGKMSSLFISREIVRMKRGGENRTEMVFDPALPLTRCDYTTPYGVIPMEIRTGRISVLDGRTDPRAQIRIRARILYELRMDDSWALQCSVTITVSD